MPYDSNNCGCYVTLLDLLAERIVGAPVLLCQGFINYHDAFVTYSILVSKAATGFQRDAQRGKELRSYPADIGQEGWIVVAHRSSYDLEGSALRSSGERQWIDGRRGDRARSRR